MAAYLQYIAYYFPADCLTNERLSVLHPEWSAEKISIKTGIYKRYLSAHGETALDMAEQAATKLFEKEHVDRSIIDYVLLCTQSPDYVLPSSACILQDRLNISEKCGAFDFNLGCSGFVYGLGIAKGLILSGQAHNVLLVTSETYTKYLHPADKSCQTIFGDGAAASLISAEYDTNGMNLEILQPIYRTIGSKYTNLIVETGASRNPRKGQAMDVLTEEGTFLKNDDYLFMDGKAIFDFSAEVVPTVVNENLVQNGCSKEDISLFVFHQANKFMLNFARIRCGIDNERFVYDMEDGGNTVSSTIPIALKRVLQNKDLQYGAKVLLCGFGVGLSVGSVVLQKA